MTIFKDWPIRPHKVEIAGRPQAIVRLSFFMWAANTSAWYGFALFSCSVMTVPEVFVPSTYSTLASVFSFLFFLYVFWGVLHSDYMEHIFFCEEYVFLSFLTLNVF